jgi:hypothetical protein
MPPQTIPFPARPHLAAALPEQQAQHLALNAEDGTLPLLRSGFLIAGVAALAMCLTLWVLGGIGPDGPHTQTGWLALMISLMCMPFGLLLLLLGGAKWLRNHALSRIPAKHFR